MTKEWKDAIRKKRKFTKKIPKNQLKENRFTKKQFEEHSNKMQA